MKRILRYGTFLAAIAGIVAMISVMRTIRGQEPEGVAPPPITPAEKPFPHTLAGTGIIEALQENVAIGVPEAGLVQDVYVKVGQPVKKGDPLLKLDDRQLQAQLLMQRADVDVARAGIDVSRATQKKAADALTRLQAVQDPRAISQDDLTNRQNEVAVVDAQVVSAMAQAAASEAKMKQTETLLSRLTVVAPRDGSVLQVSIRAGEYAGIAPKVPAILLGDTGDFQVRCDIDEQNAPRVRPGQRAVAYLKGDTKRPMPLTFDRIEPYIIPKASLTGASTERVDTRVLQVIYRLPRPKDAMLYAGQQVDVLIEEKPES
jgi:HlyD family secretion protein